MVIKNALKVICIGLTILLGPIATIDGLGKGAFGRMKHRRNNNRFALNQVNSGRIVYKRSLINPVPRLPIIPKKQVIQKSPVPVKFIQTSESVKPTMITQQDSALKLEKPILSENATLAVPVTHNNVSHDRPVVEQKSLFDGITSVPVIENQYAHTKKPQIRPTAKTHRSSVQSEDYSVDSNFDEPTEQANITLQKDAYEPKKPKSLLSSAYKKYEKNNKKYEAQTKLVNKKPVQLIDTTSVESTDVKANGNVANVKNALLSAKHPASMPKKEDAAKKEDASRSLTIVDKPGNSTTPEDWSEWFAKKYSNTTGWMWNKTASAWNGIKKLTFGDAFKSFDVFQKEVATKDPKTNVIIKDKVSLLEWIFIDKIGMGKNEAYWCTKIATTLLVLALYTIPSLQKSDSVLTKFIMQSIVPATIQITLGGASVAGVLSTHGMSAMVGAHITTSNPAVAKDKIALLNAGMKIINGATGSLWFIFDKVSAPFKWLFGTKPIVAQDSVLTTPGEQSADTTSTVTSVAQPAASVKNDSPISAEQPKIQVTQHTQNTPATNSVNAQTSQGWLGWGLYKTFWTAKAVLSYLFPFILTKIKDLPEVATEFLGKTVKIEGKNIDVDVVKATIKKASEEKLNGAVSQETTEALFGAFLEKYQMQLDQGLN